MKNTMLAKKLRDRVARLQELMEMNDRLRRENEKLDLSMRICEAANTEFGAKTKDDKDFLKKLMKQFEGVASLQ